MLIDVIIWLIIVGVAGTARRPNSSRVTVLEFNTVVGIMGVVLAGWLLPLAGFVLVGDIVAEIINAVIGAVCWR